MSEEQGCGEREALVTYLYDEADAAARARFERHLEEAGVRGSAAAGAEATGVAVPNRWSSDT